VRLGPLERRVLAALWDRNGDARVRDLQSTFPEVAYTTLMTTLDRLHRKGVLQRAADGRAFVYRPRVTRAEAALSFLLEEIGTLDEATLQALEQMLRDRRRALEDER